MGKAKDTLVLASKELGPVTVKQRVRQVVSDMPAPSYYSNTIDMTMSMTDFRIRLGEILEASSEDKMVVKHLATVWLAPVHAKEILNLLAAYVKKYEETFGTIPTPPKSV